MTSLRTTLCLSLPIIIALICAGCSPAASSSGDLDIRAGCAVVTATSTMAAAQVVADVRATGCRDSDGRPPSRDDTVDRLAEAVWRSLRLPVDALHVRVLDSTDAHDDSATVLTSEELEARFGPGPPGVVWPVLERGATDGIWFMLPVAYVIVGLGMVRLVRRAGVVVVVFRT